MQKFLIPLFLLFLSPHLQGQDSGYYYMYDFETFAHNKTTGYIDLLKELYRGIKFPNKFREKELEGSAKFYIISHGDKTFQIIPSETPNMFHDYVLSSLDSLTSIQLHGSEKFMTEFIVKFDLEPFDPYLEEKNIIHIVQYKKPIIQRDHTSN